MSTQMLFRIKCIIMRCREKGLWDIAIGLTKKYNLKQDYKNCITVGRMQQLPGVMISSLDQYKKKFKILQ